MTSNNNLLRIALIVVAAIFLIPFLVMLFMVPIMGLGYIWYWNGTTGSLWPLLVIGLVCLIIIFGITYLLYRTIIGLQRNGSDAALEEVR